LVLKLKDDMVPDGHRVGALDPMGTELALYPAIIKFAIPGLYAIPAPRRFINDPFHLLFIFSLQRNNNTFRGNYIFTGRFNKEQSIAIMGKPMFIAVWALLATMGAGAQAYRAITSVEPLARRGLRRSRSINSLERRHHKEYTTVQAEKAR